MQSQNKRQRPREADCTDCGGPVYYQHGKRCQPCWSLFNRGPNNTSFKGDAATVPTKRARARVYFSLDGCECEYEGCDKPAKDRHHINGDTGNNVRENIQFLCRKHHMLIDGRRELVAKALHGPHGPRLSWQDAEDIRNSPLPGYELARLYGKSQATISGIRTGKLWAKKPDYPQLTIAQKAEVVERHRVGEGRAALAREFGVSPYVVRDVVNFAAKRRVP